MLNDRYETDTETDTAHLRSGAEITLDELAVHLAAVELRLRQLARAAETPATPVELADSIDALRYLAGQVRQNADNVGKLARIVEGDVPMATVFPGGDPWGAAALGSDREAFGGPALIPSARQLLLLAGSAERQDDEETTTYPQAMAGVPRSILRSWESKAAAVRRRRERDAAVEAEVLLIACERCQAEPGEHCTTAKGWPADRAHTARQREAEARVDARLGYVGDNPVAVDA